MIRYRPEIDGLRALAVVPVVLYHAGIPGFSGGYVGVDIFFVISGYLITMLILRDVEAGCFSIVRFYERRARRILPALIFVTLACVPIAWISMIPKDFDDFAASIWSVALFVSNFHFWLESGYFDTAIELKPLVHTWSLAVEEQYYIIIPLFLVVLLRFGRSGIVLALSVVFAASLASALIGSASYPAANFYLLPGRAWELIAGGLLAVYELKNTPAVASRTANVLALLGLILLVASLFTFTSVTPHPGLLTLAPVLATVLIIRFGHARGPVNRLLSLQMLVSTGLISYSLYLWHQPIFAIARVRALDNLGIAEYFPLIGLSILVSMATWRYLETPFRNAQIVSTKTIWRLSSIAVAGTAAIGLTGASGVMRPNSTQLLDYIARTAESDVILVFQKDGRLCHNRLPDDACVIGDPRRSVTWALVGDSHAGSIAATHNQRPRWNTADGCRLRLRARPPTNRQRVLPGGKRCHQDTTVDERYRNCRTDRPLCTANGTNEI